jgi:hypothetical protein
MVADLIRASAQDIASFRFLSDDKGQVRGFDGHLEAAGSPRFVPDGVSIWEFGVSEAFARRTVTIKNASNRSVLKNGRTLLSFS